MENRRKQSAHFFLEPSIVFFLNGQSDMIFIERHTDDDTLLLLPALYSIDIKKIVGFPS